MMTPIEPQLNVAGRYTSAETCRLLGIHRNTLNNYTKAGMIECGYRRATTRRFYLGSDILKFWRAQL